MRFIVYKTPEFEEWFKEQNIPIQKRIQARIDQIQESGHLGILRYLSEKLYEFKWQNGLRVYFIFEGKSIILLLNGGLKNDQKKDIKKAKSLQKKYDGYYSF